MRIALIFLTVLLSACLGESWQAQSQQDEGSVCLEGEADGTATIVVDSQNCMSSSCSRNPVGSCSATLDGTTITVTSSFEWEQATGNVDCTDDCGMLAADCEVGPLPAGSYTVIMGDSSQTIDIPSTDECPGF